jgi:hypothetical protein
MVIRVVGSTNGSRERDLSSSLCVLMRISTSAIPTGFQLALLPTV